MTRSRLSYADAVRLLLGDDPITLLGRAAGTAMPLTASFAEGLLMVALNRPVLFERHSRIHPGDSAGGFPVRDRPRLPGPRSGIA